MSTSGSSLPSDWPDTATLERLANEFFAALTGELPLSEAVPSSPGLLQAGISPGAATTAASGLASPAQLNAAVPAQVATTLPIASPSASPDDPRSNLAGSTATDYTTFAPSPLASYGSQPPAPIDVGIPGEAELQRLLAFESGLGSVPTSAPSGLSGASGIPTFGSGIPAGVSEAPGIPSGVPEVPSSIPGFPTSFPGIPSGVPGTASGIPSGIPSTVPGLPSGVPSTVPGLPSGVPTTLSGVSSTVTSTIPGVREGLPGIPSSPNALLPGPSFYFLDETVLGRGGIQVPGYDSGVENLDLTGVRAPFDVNLVRRDFPILQEYVGGYPLVWLDNAATTQKPRAVIDRLTYFYEHENSNIHRAAHELAARATDAYESAREKVRGFLSASSAKEIVFVRGATEGINLVAQSWGRQFIGKDDEIVLTWLEHHANIVPWQQLAAVTGAKIKVAPVDDTGQVLLEDYGRLLGPKTKLVSFPQVSNALGTITPAKAIIQMAHSVGAKVLVDGAQAVSHMRVNVQDLDADWYVFSGHKVFAPTGIGVVYGKEALLNEAPPWQGGGNMISDVTFERSIYQDAPGRLEAGTGNIADAVGLGAAIDYVNKIGIDIIDKYEHELLLYATRLLKEIPGLRLIGTAAEKAGVLSFVLAGHTTQDVGSHLASKGIAVRSGHHCAQPILRRFGVESTVRPSLALYNTCADIDALIVALIQLTGSRP